MKARENPFRSDQVLQFRYCLRGESWEDLLARLERLHYRAAVVGPEGTGKTTLLRDLAVRLARKRFTPKLITLTRERRIFPPRFLESFLASLAPSDIVLLDGAEQMRRLAWYRFNRACRRAAGLIITTHHSGRLPTLIECLTDPDLLQWIVGELLGEQATAWRDTVERLYQAYDGNLRDALRAMYDLFAEGRRPPQQALRRDCEQSSCPHRP